MKLSKYKKEVNRNEEEENQAPHDISQFHTKYYTYPYSYFPFHSFSHYVEWWLYLKNKVDDSDVK